MGWLILTLVATLTGCGAGGAPTQPLVLVSGLDDHGLPEQATVPLHARPGGSVSGEVAASTLVQALEVEGEWTRVIALEAGPPVEGGAIHEHPDIEGWVGDYHLRSELHVLTEPGHCPVQAWAAPGGEPVAPLPASAQVRVTDVRDTGVALIVEVATVGDPQRTVWVDRAALSETSALAPQQQAAHAHGATPATSPERPAIGPRVCSPQG